MGKAGHSPVITNPPDVQSSREFVVAHGGRQRVRFASHSRRHSKCPGHGVEIVGRRPLCEKAAVEIQKLCIHVMLVRLQRRQTREPVCVPAQVECLAAVRKGDALKEGDVAYALRDEPVSLLGLSGGSQKSIEQRTDLVPVSRCALDAVNGWILLQ